MLLHQDNNDGLESEEAQSRGMKEDLSKLKQTLTRQLWAVASFLAPPPPSSSQSQPSSPSAHSDLRQLRFDDSAEILTKMNADSFGSKMELESDLEEHGFSGVGIIDEVLTFARNIKMHPKTWLDFPIDEEEDIDRMCVFFFFFLSLSLFFFGFKSATKKSILKFSQETNKDYLYNRFVILLI